jgi:hypothetical protein
LYEAVSKSFRTGLLEREPQMLQLSATKCSYIAILWISLVSFAAITLCAAFQRVFVVVYFVNRLESGNFWIHLRIHHSSSNEPIVTLPWRYLNNTRQPVYISVVWICNTLRQRCMQCLVNEN